MYMSSLICELIHQAFVSLCEASCDKLEMCFGTLVPSSLEKDKDKATAMTCPSGVIFREVFQLDFCSGFLSQSKNMNVRQIGNSEWVVGGSANANGCLSFDVAKNGRLVQGLTPLSPQDSWDRIFFFFVKSCAFFPQSTFTWKASQNCEGNKDQNQNL